MALDLGVLGGWMLAPIAAALIVLASGVWFASGPARIPGGDLAQATILTSASLIAIMLGAHMLQWVLPPVPLAVLSLLGLPMMTARALLLGAWITAEVRERRENASREHRDLASLHALAD